MTASDWLSSLERPPNPQGNLVFFHHSGGAARFFRSWPQHFERPLELQVVELPGRGNRFVDPVEDSLDRAAERVVEAILDERSGDGPPLVLFGHSLGAFLAYEVAWQLEEAGHEVSRLVASGALPPDVAKVEVLRHEMTDQELLDEIRAFGATPAEVLDNKELMELYLPVIRADFKMLETYEPGESRRLLRAPITAMAGKTDEHVLTEPLDGWQRFTEEQVAVRWFEGGHFYLAEQTGEVVGWLEHHLADEGAID